MKSYAEFLRGYISKNGFWGGVADGGHYHFWINDKGDKKLIDVGMDYAEFSGENECKLIPLSMLVVRIK